jgi:hypothetical protein
MAPHTWPLVSCTTSPGWRWHQRAMIGFPLVGGLLLLVTHGTIKVSARLVGLFDFLHGLRQINPDVVIRDL